MKIGISRPTHSVEESREMLATARREGFEGVQLKPAQYQEFIGSPDAFLAHYGDLASLAAGGLIYYPGNDPTTWKSQLDGLMPFASAIQASHVCLCSGVYGGTASSEQLKELAQILSEIGETARAQDLVISVHNHVDSALESESDMVRLLELLEPRLCSLTLDTAHAAKAGANNVPELVKRFQDHLLNVHLKDLNADGQFCPLGHGVLGIRPILNALHEVSYDKWLIVDEESMSTDTATAFAIASAKLREEGIMP